MTMNPRINKSTILSVGERANRGALPFKIIFVHSLTSLTLHRRTVYAKKKPTRGKENFFYFFPPANQSVISQLEVPTQQAFTDDSLVEATKKREHTYDKSAETTELARRRKLHTSD